MTEVCEMAAADLEEGDYIVCWRWRVTADEDGGVGGEEGADGVMWAEGVGGGKEALEEEEAWGCGGGNGFVGAVVDCDGGVHARDALWIWRLEWVMDIDCC